MERLPLNGTKSRPLVTTDLLTNRIVEKESDDEVFKAENEKLRFKDGRSQIRSEVLPYKLAISNNSYSLVLETLVVILSAAYAKLLIAMGIAFPLAEAISSVIRDSFYVGFYIYLYLVSIAFLIYAYAFLLGKDENFSFRWKALKLRVMCGYPQYDEESYLQTDRRTIKSLGAIRNCGSFYLRVGAIAFGIGSMIYSGLEFVQFFVADSSSDCFHAVDTIKPCLHMAFTFIQLYFIFLNSKMDQSISNISATQSDIGISNYNYLSVSVLIFTPTIMNFFPANLVKLFDDQILAKILRYRITLDLMCIHKYQTVARFGLMHMVATNLCVWLLMVIQESKHEIQHLSENETHNQDNGEGDHHNSTSPASITLNETGDLIHSVLPHVHGFNMIHEEYMCQRQNVLGQLVHKASPFLFPCTIEYSLICAAICYIMWKNIGKGMNKDKLMRKTQSNTLILAQRHHYSVDCTHTMRGLFTGILVLVAAIISVILFFVLINRSEYRTLAVLEAHVSELVLFSLTTVAVLVAMFQTHSLPYSPQRNIELDSILLIVAQLGVYLFSIFSIISGHLSQDYNLKTVAKLVVATALTRFFQATCQTIFILDASQRTASIAAHAHKKPGREMITLLLVCNFAMWIIKTMKTGRPESNPVQQNFYGMWGWTIISRVSTPLAIFFRFHSTVCLCEIWKKLYKLKKPNQENNHSSSPSVAE